MLGWLRRLMGDTSGMGTMFNVLDELYHPSAVEARRAFEAQQEQVVPAPIPGDRLLEEGRVVIRRLRS